MAFIESIRAHLHAAIEDKQLQSGALGGCAMDIAGDLLYFFRGVRWKAAPMRCKAGGLSLDLGAESGLLQSLVQLVEHGLLRRREIGKGIDAAGGEMLASVGTPYLDGMLYGKERCELAGRTAGNQREVDRRQSAEAVQPLGNARPRQSQHAVLMKGRKSAVVVEHQQRWSAADLSQRLRSGVPMRRSNEHDVHLHSSKGPDTVMWRSVLCSRFVPRAAALATAS